MTLTFTAFLCEDVAQMRLLTLVGAVSTLAETLSSAAVSFHLRHLLSPNSHSLLGKYCDWVNEHSCKSASP